MDGQSFQIQADFIREIETRYSNYYVKRNCRACRISGIDDLSVSS